MAKGFWKKITTRTLFTHPRLTLVEDEVILPQGKSTKYLRYDGLPDYVTVIVERDSQIALNKEYSYPHNEWLWQFPEGSIEPGEKPIEAARRELREEAGLSGNLSQVGMNYGNHRRSTEKDYIFVASSARKVDKSKGDDEEFGTETHWFSQAEVKNMVCDGKIVQKNALAALSLYFVRTDRNSTE
ncbi:MAG: NUDIX hydrolase [Candidatus Saccharimonadales bacterium]